MPLTNRVDPHGRIEATEHRGTLMGNRGKLHDAARRLTRTSTRVNWIYCHLRFRGRQRTVMHPRSYTELFFLDEPTALAAGHRPCAECRHPEYARFQDAWARAHGTAGRPSAAEMDAALAVSRGTVHDAAGHALPDGAMISWDGAPWLVLGDHVHRWSFAGYTAPVPRAALPGEVAVLTPRPAVGVLAAGFAVVPHPSAG